MALIKNYDQSVYSGYKTRESLVVASIKNINSLDATSGIDPDAQAYFDNIAGVAGTIGSTARTAINNFCVDAKANSIWDDLLDVCPFAGDQLAAGMMKLKRLAGAYAYTPQDPLSGDYDQATGYTGNGTTKYLKTGVLGTDLTLNSCGIAVYNRSSANSTNTQHGAYNSATESIQLYSPYSDNIPYSTLWNDANVLTGSSISGAVGWVFATRPSSSEQSLYRNNSQVATTATVGGTRPGIEIFFGAINAAGTPINFSSHSIAFSALTLGMDSTKASALYTLVQAFETALGRQV